jgi:hypothetical protein
MWSPTSDDSPIDFDSQTKAEIKTVTRWTDKLPQISEFYMCYGHDNSLDIDLGFDTDSVSTHEAYLKRDENQEWKEPRWEELRLSYILPEHPSISRYI